MGGPSAQLAHLLLLLLGTPAGTLRNVRGHTLPELLSATLHVGPPYSISRFLVPLSQAQGWQFRNTFNRHLHSCPSGPVLTHLGSGRMGKYVQGTHFWLKPGLSHARNSSCRLSRGRTLFLRPRDCEGFPVCSSTSLQGIHSICSLRGCPSKLMCILGRSLLTNSSSSSQPCLPYFGGPAHHQVCHGFIGSLHVQILPVSFCFLCGSLLSLQFFLGKPFLCRPVTLLRQTSFRSSYREAFVKEL